MWKDRPTLVTGAEGFLGRWLVDSLQHRGALVIALVRDQTEPRHQLASQVPANQEPTAFVRGSLEDFSLLQRIVHQYEIQTVFHLGAQTLVGQAFRHPFNTFEANIRGTYNLLEACRGSREVRQIIVASSDKAYGSHNGGIYTEDARLDAVFPYDVSKACCDMICSSYAHTYRLPVCVTRCGNFFGGGDLNWSRLVPGTIRSALQNKRPQLRSDGSYIRDYLYIEDAVEAYICLAEKLQLQPELAGEAFNFSLERPETVREFTENILRTLGSPLQPEILDLPEAKFEIPIQRLSAEKARRLLNWKPKYGLEEGLTRSIKWYSEYLASYRKIPGAEIV